MKQFSTWYFILHSKLRPSGNKRLDWAAIPFMSVSFPQLFTQPHKRHSKEIETSFTAKSHSIPFHSHLTRTNNLKSVFIVSPHSFKLNPCILLLSRTLFKKAFKRNFLVQQVVSKKWINIHRDETHFSHSTHTAVNKKNPTWLLNNKY